MKITTLKQDYALREINSLKLLLTLRKAKPEIYQLNPEAYMLWKYVFMCKNLKEVVTKFSNYYNLKQLYAKQEIKNYFLSFDTLSPSKGVIEELKVQLTQGNAILKASFELTGQCNVNCKHCYAFVERKKATLTLAQCKAVIDKLVEIGVIYLTLTGGECTLHKGFVTLYKYAISKGMYVSLITNGTLIESKGLIKVFKQHPPYYIKLSLYGPDPTTHEAITRVKGSFHKTWKAILALQKNKINFYVGCLAFKETLTRLPTLFEMAKKHKIPIRFYWGFIKTRSGDKTPLGYRIEKTDEELLKNYNSNFKIDFFDPPSQQNSDDKVFQCNAGKKFIHINCKADVFLCKLDTLPTANMLSDSIATVLDKLHKKRINKFSNTNLFNLCPIRYDYNQH